MEFEAYQEALKKIGLSRQNGFFLLIAVTREPETPTLRT
jgi:hypothetical protein